MPYIFQYFFEHNLNICIYNNNKQRYSYHNIGSVMFSDRDAIQHRKEFQFMPHFKNKFSNRCMEVFCLPFSEIMTHGLTNRPTNQRKGIMAAREVKLSITLLDIIIIIFFVHKNLSPISIIHRYGLSIIRDIVTLFMCLFDTGCPIILARAAVRTCII